MNFDKPIAMVVDDLLVNRRILGAILLKLGFEIVEACDGLQALEKLALTKRPLSCLFLDLNMPRLDGWQTARRIREAEAAERTSSLSPPPRIPIIVCTANDLEEKMSMGGDLLRYEPVRRSFEVSSSSAHKVHHHHHHQHQLQQQQDSSSSQLDDDSNGQMELSSEEEGETVMDSAVKAGADLVLAKPLKISVVERALDEVLGPQWRQGSSALSSSSCFSSKNSTFSELSPAAPGPTPPSTTTTMEADEWCQLNSLRGSVGDLTLLNE